MNLKFKVAPCSYEAAKFAVLNWHYSKRMPSSYVYFGVWEDEKFIGAVIFGYGANNNIGKKLNLEQGEILELVRVALKNGHTTPTSAIVAKAIKELKIKKPEVQALISYADTGQGHLGVIYQATNWIYTGYSGKIEQVLYKGEIVHKRTIYDLFGGNSKAVIEKNNAKIIQGTRKHTYFYLFNNKLKNKLVALPYPKKQK